VGRTSIFLPFDFRYPRQLGHRKLFFSRTTRLSRLHVMCVLACRPSIHFRALFFFSSFFAPIIIIDQKLSISKKCTQAAKKAKPFPQVPSRLSSH
jgi:hypothetical protein